MNISNKLTILRIILAFFTLWFILWDSLISLVIAFIVFILASLTDYFDGFFARKHDLITDLGKILDPIADKILIIVVFIGFLELRVINSWMLAAIILREFIITSVRLYALNKGIVLEARFLGKQKTVAQIAGIIFIFIALIFFKLFPAGRYAQFIYHQLIPGLMWYIVFITVLSGLHYLWQNRKAINTF